MRKYLIKTDDIYVENQRRATMTKQKDPREQKSYWNFILSGQKWDYSQYGLINFIQDIFGEVE